MSGFQLNPRNIHPRNIFAQLTQPFCAEKGTVYLSRNGAEWSATHAYDGTSEHFETRDCLEMCYWLNQRLPSPTPVY